VPPVPKIVCIGGAAVDRKYRAQGSLAGRTSNPVTSECLFGGVARNVAENLAKLGAMVSLVSAVGADDHGRSLVADLQAQGIDAGHVAVVRDHGTAEYVAVLEPNGDLAIGLADMAIFDWLQPTRVLAALDALAAFDWVFADCNLPAESLGALILRSGETGVPLAVDAVSVAKARRLPRDLNGVGLLVLNRDEAVALTGDGLAGTPDRNHAFGHARNLLARGAARVIVTQGQSDLVVADALGVMAMRPYEANLVDATGAGDALIAATIRGLVAGDTLAEAARLGVCAAALTVESRHSVRPDLSFGLIEVCRQRQLQRLSKSEAP
jgi:pseudouridine kinase